MSRAPAPPSNRTGPAWSALAALGLSGVLVLLGAEWLFFVTKVSFLSSLPAVERFSVPTRVAAWMTAAVALYLGALRGLYALAARRVVQGLLHGVAEARHVRALLFRPQLDGQTDACVIQAAFDGR